MNKISFINTLDTIEKTSTKLIHYTGISVTALSALPLLLALPALPGAITFICSIGCADYLFDNIIKIGN